MEVLATVRVKKTDDLYKIVNSLNRTLKEENLVFGLKLDETETNTMIFTIYRT
ncbi:MAG TPA: YpmA family protein [Bacillales bacterium]